MVEWARVALRQEARRELGGDALESHQALRQLFACEAPIDNVDSMIEESVAGRLR